MKLSIDPRFARVGLSRTVAALAAAAALLVASPAVLAGGGELVETKVTALSGANELTVSADAFGPVPFAVGYKVHVENVGGSTATNIKLVVDALPAGTDAATLVKPAFCSLAGLRLECTLGKLAAGRSFPDFYLYWDVKLDTLPTAGQKIVLSGTTYYAEGNNKNAIASNSSYAWPEEGDRDTEIGLTTVDTSGAFAIVPPIASGANDVTLFTSANDKFHTRVKVPKSEDDAALASIKREETFTDGCANFLECFQTELNIALIEGGSVFALPLEISLTHRGDNLINGFLPKKVVIKYWKDGLLPGTDPGHEVAACARDAGGNPVLPAVREIGEPCLAEVLYQKGTDAVFKLLNDTNGSYRVF